MKLELPYRIVHICINHPLPGPEWWIEWFAQPHLLVLWWDEHPDAPTSFDLLPPAEGWPVGQLYTDEHPLPLSQSAWEQLLQQTAQPALDAYSHSLSATSSAPTGDDAHSWPSVSVVICTSGTREARLVACIKSLMQATPPPDEWILVDNSMRGLSLSQPLPSEVQLVREARRGLDYARNAGWKAAHGDVVLFVDDDVEVHPRVIHFVREAFARDCEVHALTGLVLPAALDTLAQRVFEAYWGFQRGFLPRLFTGETIDREGKKWVPVWEIGAGACMAFRRTVLEGCGGFDQRLDAGAAGCNGDTELWYRLLVQDFTICYEPKAVVFHHHRASLSELHRQIFFYLRGFTTALLISYQQFRRKADLQHLTHTLPRHYLRTGAKALRRRFHPPYNTWPAETLGYAAGWIYFFRTRNKTSYPEPSKPIVLSSPSPRPLVSVIITCYQQAHYLPEAIQSVLQQTYAPLECLVVDDGSTDHTAQVARQFPEIRYLYQTRQGLAAARNTGVCHARGEWIIFLDADDWLYPAAVETQLRHARLHPHAALITGHHDKVSEDGSLLKNWEPAEVPTDTEDGHLRVETALLQGNYIGMHAAVCYRRAVFRYLRFDRSLRAAEDYDLYLRAARLFCIHSHLERIAAYRLHKQNMSNRIGYMVQQVLHVLRRHHQRWPSLQLQVPYAAGKRFWETYYAQELLRRLQFPYFYGKYAFSMAELSLCLHRIPRAFLREVIVKLLQKSHHMINSAGLARKWRRPRVFRPSWVAAYVPPKGKLKWGDLRQTRPFSARFGFDRGRPVDRYYIEQFLQHYCHLIRGHVLEIGDNTYTRRFGGDRVTRSEVLHVRNEHPGVTIVGDLCQRLPLPDGLLDTIILTQTLHLLEAPERAIAECHRLLKPGGALLITVPGISAIDHDEWRDNWQGSYTAVSLKRLLCTCFAPEHLNLHTYGNVLAATAFLYGLADDELSTAEKNDHDPHYPVIIAACAIHSSR